MLVRSSHSAPTTVIDVLERVTIEGLKSLDSVTVDLGRLNLLVGPNGAGKSNFIEAFELLGQIVRRELARSVGVAGGASTLLHSTTTQAESIRLKLEFAAQEQLRNAYEAVLVPSVDDELVFGSETAFFHDTVKYAEPMDIPLGAGHKETRLEESGNRVAGWVVRELRRWVVFHFHDTSRRSPVKQKGPIDDNETLNPDGSNLAALLFAMRETDRTSYDRIVDGVQLVAPFFDDFRLRPDRLNADRIQLEWKQRGSSSYLNANALSDGTLRFMCIVTLLLQPKAPSLILLDEPELGLHPFAIHQLADLVRSSHRQVILSTQSVTLLNQMEIDDVLIVEQREGASTVTRPSLDGLEAWLDEFSVGEMWEKNLLGGRPVQR